MKGLLLTGGKSRRMGQDKASLILRDGLTQTERGIQLLNEVCDEVFVSVAYDSKAESAVPQLRDRKANMGPLAGLDAAFANDSNTEWLVLACDLPLIDSETIRHLVAAGTGTRAYRNRLDQRAEPLCAIYSASSHEALTEWINADKRCARHFLESLEPQLFDLPHPYALDNTNTPEDLIELQARLDGTATMKTLKLLHFAKLQDEIGTYEQSYQTEASTAAAVYDELRLSYNLSLRREHLKVAINSDFADWGTAVNDGDELVFMPPVSGG